MRRRAVAGLLAALVCAGCGSEPEGALRTREIIDDLVARDFGAASSRYRMFEEQVLAPDAAPQWRRGLEHGDATVREWAVDALSRIGDPADVARVEARLDDVSRGVREEAVDALARLDRSAAGAAFRRRLALDAPEQVTLAAAGLTLLEDRAAAGAILDRFRDRGLPEATRSALTTPLAALGDARIADAMVEAALDATLGAQLQRLAAEAALAIEEGDEVARARRLEESPDDYIRALAATMIEVSDGS